MPLFHTLRHHVLILKTELNSARYFHPLLQKAMSPTAARVGEGRERWDTQSDGCSPLGSMAGIGGATEDHGFIGGLAAMHKQD